MEWGRSKLLLPFVLGLTDGILTTLVLTAGQMGQPKSQITPGLALRVATSAFASGVFVYFVSTYSEMRAGLAQAERQLNLVSRGKLATSRLGRQVAQESGIAAAVAGAAAFGGALIPFIPALRWPAFRLGPLTAALVGLAILGAGLARTARGDRGSGQ